MSKRLQQRGVELLLGTLVLTVIGGAPPPGAVANESRLYAPCVVCHQPNAWGSPDGAIPNLAGQQQRYLEKQMSLFRTGARMDLAMQIVSKHPTFSSPETIAALSQYLSALAANPRPVQGAGEHLQLGKDAFEHICRSCHGADGRGNAANRVPSIGGQHYPYLRTQIDAAAQLHNDLAPPEMTSALRGMASLEKDALADYISRLGTSEVAEVYRYTSVRP